MKAKRGGREAFWFLPAAVLLLLVQAPAQAGWEEEWKRVVAAAKKEGRLSVSVHSGEARRRAIMKFQEAFPEIRMEVSTDPSGKFTARVRQERRAGVYDIDVRVGGPRRNHSMIPEGVFVPLRPAILLPEILDDSKWLGGFAGGFSDREKKYSYASIAELSGIIQVNRDLVPEAEFNRVDDIVNPKWKGKLAMRDPRTGGSGQTAVNILLRTRGEEFIGRLLVHQAPALSADNRQVAEWVVRGRHPIAVGLSDVEIAYFKTQGVGLNVQKLLLPETLHISLGGEAAALMDRAPNPNAAKVFLNWFLSREGQLALSQLVASNSRRLDVPVVQPEHQITPEQYLTLFNKDLQDNEVFADRALKVAKELIK